jgi:hypothetical protein
MTDFDPGFTFDFGGAAERAQAPWDFSGAPHVGSRRGSPASGCCLRTY